MQNLTLRQEVAQMVMPRLEGERLGATSELGDSRYLDQVNALLMEGVGGFILFGGSLEHTPRRLQELQSSSRIPLLIASDVERGLGQQLSGGTHFPGQRAVASAINRRSKKDTERLERMLDAVRTETRAAGIHAVFSPVMDVNNNPDNPIICTRAFGEEPEVVEWFGSRYIRQLQKPSGRGRVDLLACAKHFPGHGDTDQDSHSVLPVIHADRQRLNRIELRPFREAVKDGVGMVMVAHLMVPALEPEKPTTFSKKTVTALLREGMEYDGLIVSDALDMGALAGAYSQEEIAVRAVEAGMDILLHPRDALATVRAVTAAVEEGRLTRQRIRESADRIIAAKTRLGLFDRARKTVVPVDTAAHRQVAAEISRSVPRILFGDRKALPLPPDAGIACFVLDDDNNRASGDPFIRAMREQFKHFLVMVLTPGTDMPESLVRDSIKAADIVVLAVFSRIAASKGRSGLDDRLQDAATRIVDLAGASRSKTVVISFDSPYVLGRFTAADVRVAAYDRMDPIQRAAAALLAGNR